MILRRQFTLNAGIYEKFCHQSCMIMPDGLVKTLRVDGKFDVLYEPNKV